MCIHGKTVSDVIPGKFLKKGVIEKNKQTDALCEKTSVSLRVIFCGE